MAPRKSIASDAVLLIDASYLLFYRYHATKRWLSFQENEEMQTKSALIDAFRKHLDDQMKKYAKTYKDIYMCCDCSRDDIWRHDYIEGYKGERKSAPEDFEFLSSIYREVYRKYAKAEFKHGRLEADDIAYQVVKKLRAMGRRVVVVTGDRDYLQMADGDNVCIMQANGKALGSTGDAHADLLTKILIGDKSDNISPVKKRLGKATVAKLVEGGIEALDAWLEKEGCRASFEKNKLIIDLSQVPEKYLEGLEINV